jgi:hypothetical protein
MRFIFSMALGLMVATSLFPNAALACSGPGVGRLVDANIHFSGQLFAVTCFLFAGTAVLFFFRRKRVSLVIALIVAFVLALHPVWTVSAAGDCGGSKAMASLKATGFAEVLFFAQLALSLFPFVRGGAHNKSLDASGGSLLRIIIGPAMLE